MSGTHVDAVKHLRGPDAPGVEGIPLEYCYSDGVVLDFTHKESGTRIFPDEIDEALEKIGYTLKERDIVLMHTGAGAYQDEERYRTDHCGMTAEATRHLIAHGVRMMGVDAITFDPPVWAMFEQKHFWEAHLVMMDEDYWHLENITNLDALPSARFQALRLSDQVDGNDAQHRFAQSRSSMTRAVVWFDDGVCQDVRVAGGKGASLAAMAAAGLNVPPGVRHPRRRDGLAVDARTPSERMPLVSTGREPRRLSVQSTHHGGHRLRPTSVLAAPSRCARRRAPRIPRRRASLGSRRRSSRSKGRTTSVDRVVECWASFFSERALFYRSQKGSLGDLDMAVVVQTMIDAEKSGVALHRRIRSRGDGTGVLVEAVFGLGEQVVSGRGDAGSLHHRPPAATSRRSDSYTAACSPRTSSDGRRVR